MTDAQLDELIDEWLEAVEENDGEAEESAAACIFEEFVTNAVSRQFGRTELQAQATKIKERMFK